MLSDTSERRPCSERQRDTPSGWVTRPRTQAGRAMEAPSLGADQHRAVNHQAIQQPTIQLLLLLELKFSLRSQWPSACLCWVRSGHLSCSVLSQPCHPRQRAHAGFFFFRQCCLEPPAKCAVNMPRGDHHETVDSRSWVLGSTVYSLTFRSRRLFWLSRKIWLVLRHRGPLTLDRDFYFPFPPLSNTWPKQWKRQVGCLQLQKAERKCDVPDEKLQFSMPNSAGFAFVSIIMIPVSQNDF